MSYQKRTVGIKGYEDYQCDTNGVVYGKNGNPLKPNINSHGYRYVVFCENGKTKTFQVHRIVALTFIPNPNNYPIVNHIDGNKLNCKVENLEWCTVQYNSYHSAHILGNCLGSNNANAKAVEAYDKKTKELKLSFPCIADAGRYFAKGEGNYRTYETMIWKALKGLLHTYKGYVWKYKKMCD